MVAMGDNYKLTLSKLACEVKTTFDYIRDHIFIISLVGTKYLC